MKIATQRSKELIELGELIGNMPVAMLSNVDADGVLQSRPMAPLKMDADASLWFFTDCRSPMLDYLRVANLSFADPARAIYVSLSGHAEVSMDRDEINRLWMPFAEIWFPGGPDSPHLALLKFVPDTVEFWNAPHTKTIRMFALSDSMSALNANAAHHIDIPNGSNKVAGEYVDTMPTETA